MKLRVYFKHCTMTKEVASKGTWLPKTYNKTPMFSDFPEGITLEDAIKSIYEQYGERPERPLHCDHSFAEIITHTLIPDK